MIAVEMKEGEFCSAAADIKLGRAIVEARVEHAGEPTVEPVWKEIAGQRVDVGEQFRQELLDDFIAEVWCGIRGARRIHAVDEISHIVILMVDRQIH